MLDADLLRRAADLARADKRDRGVPRLFSRRQLPDALDLGDLTAEDHGVLTDHYERAYDAAPRRP